MSKTNSNWKETFERVRKARRENDDFFDDGNGGTRFFSGSDSLDPIPLIPTPDEPAEFPMEALGALRRPAEAIARVVQAPDALAAQAVLAIAALATQAYADVVMPHSGVSPISLFFLSICESGDRKTSVDKLASRGVADFERELRDTYKVEIAEWTAEHAAWAATKKKIEADAKNKSKDELRLLLEDLGPAPAAPLSPIATISDFTIEGLSKGWTNYPPSLALMTSEGGAIIGGAAMSDDAKLRTAAGLSSLWDGGEIRRARASDGLTLLFGRRLSCHLMAQPEVARRLLSDPVIKDQGLMARFFTSEPKSLKGGRFFRAPEQDDLAEIDDFSNRVYDLLHRQPVARDRVEGLRPRQLPFSADARDAWIYVYDYIERDQKDGAALRKIGAFSSKAAEHIARIAAVITVFDDPGAIAIPLSAVESASDIVAYYIKELLRLTDDRAVSQELLDAEALRQWILARNGDEKIAFRDIIRTGPRATRKKFAADRAVAILINHGWLRFSNERAGILLVRRGSDAADASGVAA